MSILDGQPMPELAYIQKPGTSSSSQMPEEEAILDEATNRSSHITANSSQDNATQEEDESDVQQQQQGNVRGQAITTQASVRSQRNSVPPPSLTEEQPVSSSTRSRDIIASSPSLPISVSASLRALRPRPSTSTGQATPVSLHQSNLQTPPPTPQGPGPIRGTRRRLIFKCITCGRVYTTKKQCQDHYKKFVHLA